MNSSNLLVLNLLFFSISLEAQRSQLKITDNVKVTELMNTHNVPAVAIGIIEQGALVTINTYGELKEEHPAPYNAIFDVASLTKSIVAMTTLKLVEHGDWDLDEALSNYWVDPDIKDNPNHKKITTRFVLSHQAGFNNWRWMNDSKKLEFHFKPGTGFKYSGEGFEYLRRALEIKFKKSLQRLSDSLVFKPLKMKDTRHSWDNEVDIERFAVAHDSLKNPYTLPKKNVPNGADNVLTTIGDFGLFGIEILKKLQEGNELYLEMASSQNHVRKGVDVGFSWFLLNNLANDEYALFNAGGDPGTHTVMILLPRSNRGLIIFTNGDKGHLLYKELIPHLLDVGSEIIQRI